jgi:hypothetical protein
MNTRVAPRRTATAEKTHSVVVIFPRGFRPSNQLSLNATTAGSRGLLGLGQQAFVLTSAEHPLLSYRLA